MAYSAMDVAKFIITYGSNKGEPVSNLKLQKILYYLWIEYYKAKQKYLFSEQICAWQLGPVVPEVYYEFCSFAGIPIVRSYEIAIEKSDERIVSSFIDKYLSIPASTLVNMTHKKGFPWDIIYKEGEGIRNEIPYPLIISKECSVSNEN